MTLSIFLLLLVLTISLILFWSEWLSPDVTALGALLTLIIFRLIPLEEAFLGFGSDTVMVILGLLIMTAAFMRTGVVNVISSRFFQFTSKHPNSLLPVTMIVVTALGAFISNTASVAFFLPIILSLSQQTKISASRLLMPMAFASILSSSVTLISTSTNVVISGLVKQAGLSPLGMFELAPVGIPVMVIGILYMQFIGQHLIPERSAEKTLTDSFDLRPYLAEVHVLKESRLAGSTLGQAGFGQNFDLIVLAIIRNGKKRFDPSANTKLQEGDTLLVEGSSESILKIKHMKGVDIQADAKFSDADFQKEGLGLAEVVLLSGSPFLGRTPKNLQMREKYRIQILAINRRAGYIHSKIADTRLQLGDVLLVQGKSEQLTALQNENAFDVLGMMNAPRFNRQKALLVLGIFILALLLGTFEIVSLSVAMLIGAFLVFVTRTISPENAYRQVDWKIIILIGSMLAFGSAMHSTGTAEFLANSLTNLVGTWHPLWLLTGFFVLTVLLTQPMSNQAAAAVVIPIALQTATQLGLNPRTFAVMIAVAASTSYLTPLEPACLMVYGPGRYRFIDFLKVGGLLTLIIYILAIIIVPLVWQL
ncbi:MAG: citrate transporter [Chloroflexi bacterium OLB14]|nr:MAG: citrate transporter [Chloroflexi bacterium OLB14]